MADREDEDSKTCGWGCMGGLVLNCTGFRGFQFQLAGSALQDGGPCSLDRQCEPLWRCVITWPGCSGLQARRVGQAKRAWDQGSGFGVQGCLSASALGAATSDSRHEQYLYRMSSPPSGLCPE